MYAWNKPKHFLPVPNYSSDKEGVGMRGLCRNHNEVRKVHEDFEFADEIICWECGNKIIELVGQNFMKYLDKFEKELGL